MPSCVRLHTVPANEPATAVCVAGTTSRQRRGVFGACQHVKIAHCGNP